MSKTYKYNFRNCLGGKCEITKVLSFEPQQQQDNQSNTAAASHILNITPPPPPKNREDNKQHTKY